MFSPLLTPLPFYCWVCHPVWLIRPFAFSSTYTHIRTPIIPTLTKLRSFHTYIPNPIFAVFTITNKLSFIQNGNCLTFLRLIIVYQILCPTLFLSRSLSSNPLSCTHNSSPYTTTFRIPATRGIFSSSHTAKPPPRYFITSIGD